MEMKKDTLCSQLHKFRDIYPFFFSTDRKLMVYIDMRTNSLVFSKRTTQGNLYVGSLREYRKHQATNWRLLKIRSSNLTLSLTMTSLALCQIFFHCNTYTLSFIFDVLFKTLTLRDIFLCLEIDNIFERRLLVETKKKVFYRVGQVLTHLASYQESQIPMALHLVEKGILSTMLAFSFCKSSFGNGVSILWF